MFNPLNPHNALKHHFASMKNQLISWVLNEKFNELFLKINDIFFYLSPISSHLHPLHVANCDSISRLVVDENNNGKFRLERVKHQDFQTLDLKLNKYD